MESGARPIGILDSGVGGLTVLKEIIRQLPGENIVYYGDTLHLPYGPRDLGQVKEFVFEIGDFLLNKKKCKAIVLACNTATSAALNSVREKYPVPVFGTIDSAVSKVLHITNNNRIGVIGTRGTIASGLYQQALLESGEDVLVFDKACPRFVELVEAGNFSGKIVDEVIKEYLTDLKAEGIDSLILGCTHFPYLIPPLKKFLGPGVTLISSAVEMAAEVKIALEKRELFNKKSSATSLKQQEFFVSDSSKISSLFLKRGREFLNLPALNFREKNIFTERVLPDEQSTFN